MCILQVHYVHTAYGLGLKRVNLCLTERLDLCLKIRVDLEQNIAETGA